LTGWRDTPVKVEEESVVVCEVLLETSIIEIGKGNWRLELKFREEAQYDSDYLNI
jgi:hypothetical protein